MYYIRTPKTIKPENEQNCYIDGNLALVNWRGDALLVNNEQHRILHSHIDGDDRVFTCASPPKNEPIECEHCEDPDKNGVYPAENGLHPIKYAVEGSGNYIPCRKGIESINVSKRTWTDNYRKATPAII